MTREQLRGRADRVSRSPLLDIGYKLAMAIGVPLVSAIGILVWDKVGQTEESVDIISERLNIIQDDLFQIRTNNAVTNSQLEEHQRRIRQLENWRNGQPRGSQ